MILNFKFNPVNAAYVFFLITEVKIFCIFTVILQRILDCFCQDNIFVRLFGQSKLSKFCLRHLFWFFLHTLKIHYNFYLPQEHENRYNDDTRRDCSNNASGFVVSSRSRLFLLSFKDVHV